MNNLTPKTAKQVALSFVEKRHNPLNTNGYLGFKDSTQQSVIII